MPKRDLSWLNKHYMEERDFEAEHALHDHYPEILPHYHEFYELFFFVSGNTVYVAGDERYQLEPGDMILVRPNIMHNPVFLDHTVPYERYVVWITAGLMERLIRLDPDIGLFLKQNTKNAYLFRSKEEGLRRYRSSFQQICKAYEGRTMCYRSEGVASILSILSEYNRALAGQDERIRPVSRDSLITDILHYVSENLTNDLSLDLVAEKFYTNKFHLSHLFKKEMRIPFYQYVIQMRLILGKNHILDGMPVNRVWEACGFSDHAGFYRAFRKFYGISPSEFKQLHIDRLTSVFPDAGEKKH